MNKRAGSPDTNFQVVCHDGTTQGTPVDTGVVAVAGEFYLWAIDYDSATNTADVYCNGTLVATVDTSDNVPTSGATKLQNYAGVDHTGGTRSLTVSAIQLMPR
jgi:hypothetical protein